MNISQAQQSLEYCFKAGLTPHFIGKHGVGKSSIVYQYAAANGYEVAEIRVGQMADAGDLIGLQEFLKDPDTNLPFATKHILPNWFMQAVGEGKKVIIFIDELNRGHKDLLQAIFELVYDRSLKGVKIGTNCHVVAASNPATDDYSVLDFSDSAFSDRFVHLKFEPTIQEFIDYGRGIGNMSPNVLDFIQEYTPMLENKELQDFDLKFVKPSRRSWERISKLESVKVPADLELELFMGVVGFEAAHAYLKFRETNFKALKADVVLNSYKSTRKDVQAAVKKGRTDMLGTLNQELGQLLKGMESLTAAQADNLADLVADLPVEHAYTLAKIVADTSECTRIITDVDPKKMIKGHENKGLFGHKKFTDKIQDIQGKRQKMQLESTTEEVVPF